MNTMTDQEDPHAESKAAVRQFKDDWKKLSKPQQGWNAIVIGGVFVFFAWLLIDALMRSFGA
jgi:uncharacterized membrane protein